MGWIQLGGHKPKGPPRGWALVDDADDEWAAQWKWSLIDGYAMRTEWRPPHKGRLVSLHRSLLGLVPGDGLHCDHINRNRLDNRRSNLRIVTQQENNQNRALRGGTSRHRGVRWSRGRWQAYVYVDGKFKHLGVFEDEDEAGEVARVARIALLPGAVD